MQELFAAGVTGVLIDETTVWRKRDGFQPTVVVFNPNMELRWIGHLLMPGIFDGEHGFTIEPIEAERVRFVQEERFTGLLVPFLARSLDQRTRAGFESMNAALK